MPRFNYKAKSPSGEIVQGAMEAANPAEARIKLRAQNLETVTLVAVLNTAAKRKGESEGFFANTFAPRVQTRISKYSPGSLQLSLMREFPLWILLKF